MSKKYKRKNAIGIFKRVIEQNQSPSNDSYVRGLRAGYIDALLFATETLEAKKK